MGACARNMQSDSAEIKPAQCCIKLVFHLTYTLMHGSTKLKFTIILLTMLSSAVPCQVALETRQPEFVHHWSKPTCKSSDRFGFVSAFGELETKQINCYFHPQFISIFESHHLMEYRSFYLNCRSEVNMGPNCVHTEVLDTNTNTAHFTSLFQSKFITLNFVQILFNNILCLKQPLSEKCNVTARNE